MKIFCTGKLSDSDQRGLLSILHGGKERRDISARLTGGVDSGKRKKRVPRVDGDDSSWPLIKMDTFLELREGGENPIYLLEGG